MGEGTKAVRDFGTSLHIPVCTWYAVLVRTVEMRTTNWFALKVRTMRGAN